MNVVNNIDLVLPSFGEHYINDVKKAYDVCPSAHYVTLSEKVAQALRESPSDCVVLDVPFA